MRWFGKRRGKDGGKRQGPEPHGRDAGDQAPETPQGLSRHRGSGRPGGGGHDRPPGGPGRRPRALAGRDRLRGRRSPWTGWRIFVESAHRHRRPGRRHPACRRPPWTSGCGPSAARRGAWLRFWGSATLAEGESTDYSLPLHGPAPSFTVSWEDTLGQAGALTVKPEQIPYPLPAALGELCDLRMTSLGWTPGAVSGVIDVRVRHARRRGEGRASDGGRAPERHRDVADGRPGDGSHGDRRHRQPARRIPASPSSPTERPGSNSACPWAQRFTPSPWT